MKLAIVGPTHPYKGGIAQHTTELAHQLTKAGHEVTIISWRNQYPFFYPGEQFVPNDKPELPLFPDTQRALSWKNPLGWAHWAHRLRRYDHVIFIWWVPTIQGPIYITMIKLLGKKGPRTTLICHNVIQHKAGPVDRKLARIVFNAVDQIIVHSSAQAELARSLTTTPVTTLALPAHLPGNPKHHPAHQKLYHRLLFFGLVRHYKGVDVLINALSRVPGITLTVAGEMWGRTKEELERLITEHRLENRVTLRPGYVPAEEISNLFAKADALVLPYRSGTATQNAELAFTHGIPVIATRVGNLTERIHDGVDGLLCAPSDAISLADTIKRFYEPGIATQLQHNIPAPSANTEWQNYVKETTTHS